MATPGELVKTMAEVLGISVATVTQYDRQLAEAGLRSKGGRGTSAAKVTSEDAANLLTAIVAAPVAGSAIKEAAPTCEAYGSLRAVPGVARTENFRKFGLPQLAGLPAKHSLQKALSTLIAAAGEGEVFQIPDGRRPPLTFDAMFAITFEGPRPWAEILADGSIGEGRFSQMGRLVYNSTLKRDRRRPIGKQGDLQQSHRISFVTIRALGSLISGESP
jgi:hypothetical protein